MYSFIPVQKFVPYHDALANGARIVSENIQQKVDSGARLSPAEADKVRARSEVEQDLAVEPLERRRGVLNFVEGYQTLTLEEVEEVLDQESTTFDTDDRHTTTANHDGRDFDEATGAHGRVGNFTTKEEDDIVERNEQPVE
jgi:hypothetical protein